MWNKKKVNTPAPHTVARLVSPDIGDLWHHIDHRVLLSRPTIWEHESLICSVHHALNCAGHSLQDFLRCTQRHLSLMDSAHKTCWHNQQGSETVCNSPPMSTHRTPMFFSITALKKPGAQKIFSDIDLQKIEKRLSSQKKTWRQFSNIKRNRCKIAEANWTFVKSSIWHASVACWRFEKLWDMCERGVLNVSQNTTQQPTWALIATIQTASHSERVKKTRKRDLMCWCEECVESSLARLRKKTWNARRPQKAYECQLHSNLLHAFNKLNFLVSSTRTPILVRLFVCVVLLDAWTFLNSQKKDLHCCPTLFVCLHAFCLMFGLCLHHAHQHASLLSFVFLCFVQALLNIHQCGVLSKGEQEGHRRVSLFVCVVPSASSQKQPEGELQNMETNGTTDSSSANCFNWCLIVFKMPPHGLPFCLKILAKIFNIHATPCAASATGHHHPTGHGSATGRV